MYGVCVVYRCGQWAMYRCNRPTSIPLLTSSSHHPPHSPRYHHTPSHPHLHNNLFHLKIVFAGLKFSRRLEFGQIKLKEMRFLTTSNLEINGWVGIEQNEYVFLSRILEA